MNIKFNSKIDSLLKEYNRGVLNMQTQNQHGVALAYHSTIGRTSLAQAASREFSELA